MEHAAFAATWDLQRRATSPSSSSSSSSPSSRLAEGRRTLHQSDSISPPHHQYQYGPASGGNAASSSNHSSNRSKRDRRASSPTSNVPTLPRWVRRRRQKGEAGGPQGVIGLEEVVAQTGGNTERGECSNTPPLPSLSLSWKEILKQLPVADDPTGEKSNDEESDDLDGLASLLGLESSFGASNSRDGSQGAGSDLGQEEDDEHWRNMQQVAANRGKEQQQHYDQPTTSEKRRAKTIGDVEPFFLKDLPPTKAGRLFQEYEMRYWQCREEGQIDPRHRFFSIGNGRNTSVGDLDGKEIKEFRTYTKRFHDTLAAFTARKHREKSDYRLKRFGPKRGRQKTAQQQRETKIASAKANLITRMRQILAGEAKREWKDEHTRRMQEVVAMVKLKPREKLVELYKKAVDLGKVPSCVDLPSE